MRIFYYALFSAAVFFVVVRRNHLAMHLTKKFYLNVMVISIALSLLSTFNQFEILMNNYSTSASFHEYLIRYFVSVLQNALFYAIAVILPCLSGELLHYETLRERKEGAFLHYLHTSFFTRHAAQMVCIGYFVCIILLGLQSALINFGEKYLGVWTSHSWISQLSTTYWPFLAALTVGFSASVREETLYRMFAISWGKKIFGNIGIAVFLSSLLWGFAHSNYAVYPMWFRGLEVTLLGLFISFIYLKFGIIPVIVGHFLFDVFWACAGYLAGTSQPIYYVSSICVLLLPLIFGIIAFLMNRKTEEHPMRWHLNQHQKFNVNILTQHLNQNRELYLQKDKEQLTQEICSHGWDIAVVEVAIDSFDKKLNKQDND